MYIMTVRNKILYRRQCHLTVQSALRGWLARREYLPRIKGMARIHKLYSQMPPMREIIEQLKKDKDAAKKRVKALEKDMDDAITKIQVIKLALLFIFLTFLCFK